jgi:hypothetical protein
MLRGTHGFSKAWERVENEDEVSTEEGRRERARWAENTSMAEQRLLVSMR